MQKKSIRRKVKKLRKKLKKLKKHGKKETKHVKKKSGTEDKQKAELTEKKRETSKEPKSSKKKDSKKSSEIVENGSSSIGPSIDLMSPVQPITPMTKEEWEKQESVVRRVYDNETGRTRLIKGSGEIMEECVSRERHRAINKAATQTDGEYFQQSVKARASK